MFDGRCAIIIIVDVWMLILPFDRNVTNNEKGTHAKPASVCRLSVWDGVLNGRIGCESVSIHCPVVTYH